MIVSVQNFVFRPYLRVSLLSILPLCLGKVATLDESDFNRTKACHSFLCYSSLPCSVVCSSSLHFHVKMMVKSVMSS